MESLKHSLWVEKYRPNKLDNYIGNDHLKSKVSVYLESGDIPHLLLFGRAGTGKTTIAIAKALHDYFNHNKKICYCATM